MHESMTAIQQPGQWQDISLAKKDGTTYLLMDEKGYVELGSWKEDWFMGEQSEDEDTEFKGEEGWFSNDGDDYSLGYYYSPINPVKFLDFTLLPGYINNQ